MKKEIEAFVNAANEQELEAAWNNLCLLYTSYASYVALLIAGQCALSLFPDWVTQRTIYLLVGGFLLALLFYEVRPVSYTHLTTMTVGTTVLPSPREAAMVQSIKAETP